MQNDKWRDKFNDVQNGLASWKINVALCFNGTKADKIGLTDTPLACSKAC